MNSTSSETNPLEINHWHEWKINNFNDCIRFKSLASISFIVRGYGMTKWYLSFSKYDSSYYSLHLQLESSPSMFEINLEMGIIDTNKSFLKSFKESTTLKNPHGTNQFLTLQEFRNKESEFLTDNTLRIGCKIVLKGLTTNSFMRNEINFDIPPCQLSYDFSKLLNDEATADVTLNVGTTKFHAHKIILMASSSVFAGMFNNQMKESVEKKIDIEDLDPEIVEQVLKFIYTGKVDDLEDKALDLLHPADKYNLERLKAMCEKAVYENINVETAAEILVIADRYRAEQLKRFMVRYVGNHLEEVAKTTSYKEMKESHPRLVVEVLETRY